MVHKLLKTAAITFSLIITAFSAQAATVNSLSDDFNSETLALNYAGFANWNVSNGTVDLIGPGFYSYCGATRCVDLDGSTQDAGDLQTKDNFAAGTYELSFRLAGNQRGNSANDGVLVTFGDLSENFSKAAFDPFELITRIVTLGAADFLTFSHAGGDNVGLLLDDVQVSVVPLPAALPLYGAGLALLGFMGLRRKQNSTKI